MMHDITRNAQYQKAFKKRLPYQEFIILRLAGTTILDDNIQRILYFGMNLIIYHKRHHHVAARWLTVPPQQHADGTCREQLANVYALRGMAAFCLNLDMHVIVIGLI